MKKIVVFAYRAGDINPDDLKFLKDQLETEANVKALFIPHYNTQSEPIYSAAIFTVKED